MKIKYVKGDATCPQRNHNQAAIIMHICNNKHGWGAGFVLALSKKWKLPEQKYREWTDDTFKLGATQFIGVGGGIVVANMIAQDGFGGVAVKYNHLRTCLKQVCEHAKKINASVVAPKIGSGLGGGDFNIISKIIEEELCEKGIHVTIYIWD